ncbi:hypothetical protein ERK19_05055 [Lactobacillus helsingborgensis]|uniref:phosphotransferase n=1 Tax=Lactobacillus helsingborgensis TaxID=1218494 RepID=UPI00164F7367|nr:phosphotransferase [Lactobacillus helsingborgensis]MBC6356718.1 hypothetical protein [Lactobacillus helsingborgensis]
MELKQLIRKEYGLNILNLSKLTKFAHHDVYLAETTNKNKVIIKLLPNMNKKSKSSIFLQVKLAKKNIAPNIIKNNAGEYFISNYKNILFLQKYIETSEEVGCNISDLITMYKELGNTKIHGDLRPSNALYTKDHHSYFIDFEYFGPGNRSSEILKFLILESEGDIEYIYNKYTQISNEIKLQNLEVAAGTVLKEGYNFDFVLNHLTDLNSDYLKKEIKEHVLVIKTCLEKINVKR